MLKMNNVVDGHRNRAQGARHPRRQRHRRRLLHHAPHEQPRIVYTYEGTNDIHKLIIGERITGIPAFV
jgi:alkylation response protein AidB-like acyl-CoA dehydrogenase